MPTVRRCPSLGLDDDKDTCMTFATESHHCYRLAKHKTVPTDHQYEYCLNENHIRCPIFLSGDRLFPKAVKTQATAISAARTPLNLNIPKSAIKWIITLAAIFVLAFTSWWVFAKTDLFTRTDPPVQASGDLPPGVTPTITRTVKEFSPNLTMIYELTAVSTSTKNLQLSQAIPITGGATASLTKTSTSTPSPTTIACSLPDGWVVYTVKLWDTLYWLSLSVRTSVDDLVKVNCLTSQILLIGQEIYLPYYPPKASFTASKSLTPTDIPPTRTYTRTNTSTSTRTYTSTSTRTPTPTFTYTFTSVPSTNTPVTPTNTPVTPTVEPTIEPTIEPTNEPTTEPTIEPTTEPTIDPGG